MVNGFVPQKTNLSVFDFVPRLYFNTVSKTLVVTTWAYTPR